VYDVAARDLCVLNTGMTLIGGRNGDEAFEFSVSWFNEIDTSQLIALPVGSHGFKWTASDSSSLSTICEWEVIIVDNYPPEIDCNYGDARDADTASYYVRINQGQTSTSKVN
jgi:hypothetical protein